MKKLVALLLVLCSIFSLGVACGGGENSNSSVSQSESSSESKDDEDDITPAYTREGDYIWFGSYPQTKVTDSALISALDEQAGALPTSADSYDWTSYGYYMIYYMFGGIASDYMWYQDETYNGEKYRGVYFTTYRPNYTTNSSGSMNQGSGYTTRTIYWFQYEPIEWRILSESGGAALILCEMLIDSQAYQNNYKYTNSICYATDDEGNILTDENGNKIYANNYAYSTIRTWLNDNFYNTAFNDLQKTLIEKTTVDNSAATTNNPANNPYACENTEDNIFLLSYQDMTNAEYGFNASASNADTARQKKITNYAKCQGAHTATYTAGNGYWWLRSPYLYTSGSAEIANGVYGDGALNSFSYVDSTYLGVCPALKIRLS